METALDQKGPKRVYIPSQNVRFSSFQAFKVHAPLYVWFTCLKNDILELQKVGYIEMTML